jgi:hypothetical protein
MVMQRRRIRRRRGIVWSPGVFLGHKGRGYLRGVMANPPGQTRRRSIVEGSSAMATAYLTDGSRLPLFSALGDGLVGVFDFGRTRSSGRARFYGPTRAVCSESCGAYGGAEIGAQLRLGRSPRGGGELGGDSARATHALVMACADPVEFGRGDGGKSQQTRLLR